jgi:hypothetical protein
MVYLSTAQISLNPTAKEKNANKGFQLELDSFVVITVKSYS